MSETKLTPVVPEQLNCLLTDDVLEVHDRWQSIDLAAVQEAMPQPTPVDTGKKRTRAVILDGPAEVDETQTLVLALPHQQAWKPSMYIRSEITRQVVAPNSRMVVLPNNSVTDRYFYFSDAELAQMHGGDLTPFFEMQTRAIEALKPIGKVALSGFSLGGLTVLGIASTSPELDVDLVNSDEAPVGRRSVKELRKAFMESGGWGEQKEAIANAGVPALEQALNTPRLALDYARFGVATLTKESKALTAGMTNPELPLRVNDSLANNPGVFIKLGSVAGSKLFSPSVLPNTADVIQVEYSGEGTQAHATGDNPFAHALMVKEAMALRDANGPLVA